MNITDLTIGYELPHWSVSTQKWYKSQNESELNNLLSFNTLYNNAGITKDSLPAIHPYQGIKGVFNGSNCFFIDIDTVDSVDYLFDHTNELFQLVPCIYAIQKSFSGKLHIICVHNRTIVNADEWEDETKVYSIAVLLMIKKHFGIDYFVKSSEGKIPFDTHNAKWTQLFFATKNKFVVNQYCTAIKISSCDANQIKETSPQYFDVRKNDSVFISSINKDVIIGKNKEKLLIDKHFYIGKYNGNDVRWRISRIAFELFGTNAKAFCDKFFYCDKGSIYTKTNLERSVNPLIYNWLIENDYILNNPNGQLQLPKGQYLSDIQDQIEHLIEQNDYRCEIIAPTGTGKTVLINGIDKQSDLFENRKENIGIAQKYNGVVVVPYNMTNGLYNNLTCISSDNGLTRKENETVIKKNEPLVMVFDQFLIYKDLLIDRTIILDEAHTIFTDKTYRTSVVKFADFVVKNNMKIIAFTATPEIEADILKIKQFTVSAYQKPINMQLVNFEPYEIDNQTVNPNTFNFEVKLADRLKTGEQMIFFDNKNSRNLEDYIKSTKSADAVTVVRADTKENDKVKRLRENEIIETQFLVSTKAGFQGLNYKNENRITAVINFEYMSSYKSDIFQTIGRFRKSNDINVIVLYSKKDVSTVQEKIDLTNEKNKVYDDIDATQFNNVDQSVLDPDQQKIMLEMEQYFMENSTYESVLSEIKKHQNIIVKEKQYSCSNKRYDNKEKRSESDKFIEGIKNNNWNRITGNVFWDNNVDLMQQLTSEKISEKMITEIIATKKNNVLFETIAAELLTIINIANRGSVEEIKAFEEKLKKWVDTNKGATIDYDLYKYFQRQLALVKKTIKIKKRMIEENRDINDFISAVIDEFLYEQTEVKTKESEAGKKGAKKRNKRVKDLKTNEIYESITDLAAAYDKSVSWVSKHKTYWEPIS